MNWGKTYEEQQPIDEARQRAWEVWCRAWHPWFAWKPVTLKNGRSAWLETVAYHARDNDGRRPWEYRLWAEFVAEKFTAEKMS